MLPSKLAVTTQEWDLGSVFDGSVDNCVYVWWCPQKAARSSFAAGTEGKAPFHRSVLHLACCVRFWFHLPGKASGVCWGGITTCLQKRNYEVKLASFEQRRLRMWSLQMWCLQNCGC